MQWYNKEHGSTYTLVHGRIRCTGKNLSKWRVSEHITNTNKPQCNLLPEGGKQGRSITRPVEMTFYMETRSRIIVNLLAVETNND